MVRSMDLRKGEAGHGGSILFRGKRQSLSCEKLVPSKEQIVLGVRSLHFLKKYSTLLF